MSKHYSYTRRPVKPEGAWLTISSDLTGSLYRWMQRDDLTVKVSPDAGYEDSAYSQGKLILGEDGKPSGYQNPGITFPGLKMSEINGTYLPADVDPSTVRIGWNPDHRRYPVLWGIVLHEGGHFDHTRWMARAREITRADTSLAEAFGAALLLEESRIEHRHLQYRPQDTEWLAASATAIAVEELEESGQDPKIAASRACALVLARIDAGVLQPVPATQQAQEFAKNTFGLPVYRELEEIWNEALGAADDDAETMLRLGRRWLDLTGDGGDDGGEGSASELLQALADALSDMAQDAADSASGEKERRKERERQAQAARRALDEAAEQKRARQCAGIFGGTASASVLTGWRKPTSQEMRLARVTRSKLAQAYMPERTLLKTPSELPPGRVSMREAREAQGQRDRDEPLTAKPYMSRNRQHVPVPPLKVGIINDVSSSQQGPSQAAASAAWSLARAAAMIPDATVAMATFGPSLDAIIRPGQRAEQVPVIHAGGGTQHFAESVRAVEGGLSLMKQGTARLLAILTDGEFGNSEDMELRDPMLARLVNGGTRVLWLHTGYSDHCEPGAKGVRVTRVSDWELIPRMLAKEAVAALEERR